MATISSMVGTRGLLPGEPDAKACSAIVEVEAKNVSLLIPNSAGVGTCKSALIALSSLMKQDCQLLLFLQRQAQAQKQRDLLSSLTKTQQRKCCVLV